jgi:hypothetical protein
VAVALLDVVTLLLLLPLPMLVLVMLRCAGDDHAGLVGEVLLDERVAAVTVRD